MTSLIVDTPSAPPNRWDMSVPEILDRKNFFTKSHTEKFYKMLKFPQIEHLIGSLPLLAAKRENQNGRFTQPAGGHDWRPDAVIDHAIFEAFHGVSMTTNISSLANLIWSVADLLRGDFKQSQYGRIILPFTVPRRLECVLAPTRDKVLATAESTKAMPELARHKLLLNAAGQSFQHRQAHPRQPWREADWRQPDAYVGLFP